jgi:HSP20 family protein
MAKTSNTANSKQSPQTSPSMPRVEHRSHPVASLRDEVDRVFDGFFHDWPPLMPDFGRFGTLRPLHEFGMPFLGRGYTHLASADVTETETEYRVSVELPGVDEKDIELSLTDDVVTLKGEKKATHAAQDRDFHVHERSYGAFQRIFPIPDGVDRSKVEAAFSKGVLTITLPKSKEAQSKPRKVTVKAA